MGETGMSIPLLALCHGAGNIPTAFLRIKNGLNMVQRALGDGWYFVHALKYRTSGRGRNRH